MEQRANEAERREREESRPSLVLRDIEGISGFQPQQAEIQVRLTDSKVVRCTAAFYVVCAYNDGKEDAENVMATVSLPDSKFGQQLKLIHPHEEPMYTVKWDGSEDEFNKTTDAFATALIEDETLSKPSMMLGGHSFPHCFVLCFLVEGQNKIYLPCSERLVAAKIPSDEFELELYLSGKGIGAKKMQTYVIHAPDWASTTVTPATAPIVHKSLF